MATGTKHKHRRMTMVPVTKIEEVPVLDKAERTELIGSLTKAEADTARGSATAYEPTSFTNRLLRIYRGRRP